MKCKNIECAKETTGKRVYCSLSCRNIFVNKYLRNYDKVSNYYQQKKKEKNEEYLVNPKRCISCAEILPYDKRDNDYCNHSCSASSVNRTRDYNWGDKIKKSIHNYLISNGIKKEGQIGLYEIECKFCKDIFYNKRSEKVYCSDDCKRLYKRKGMDGYQGYRLDTNFKFNLSDYSDYFDFTLIELYGWYSPSNKKNNLNGVSRDHLLSVSEGFELGIDPKLISHPANCRLIKHTDNISKNRKSIITFDELLEKIIEFEKIYGKYCQ